MGAAAAGLARGFPGSDSRQRWPLAAQASARARGRPPSSGSPSMRPGPARPPPLRGSRPPPEDRRRRAHTVAADGIRCGWRRVNANPLPSSAGAISTRVLFRLACTFCTMGRPKFDRRLWLPITGYVGFFSKKKKISLGASQLASRS